MGLWKLFSCSPNVSIQLDEIGKQCYLIFLTSKTNILILVQFVHNAKYYAELRPLTHGPLKVGFASSVKNLSEQKQNLHEIPGSICYDYYENGLWIFQKEYIPKVTNHSSDASTSSTLQATAHSVTVLQGRDQVVIGVLLDTQAENELEAVRFFVNGHEVNCIMDVSSLKKSSIKPWKDPSQFLLSVAPVAYGQALLVLEREYWQYNRDNEELIPFDESTKRSAMETNENVDDENGQQDVHDISSSRSLFNDVPSAQESDVLDQQDIDNFDDYEIDPLGLRDLDWAKEYDTSLYTV